MKKVVYGICKICRKNKRLTEEHIPPKSLFNSGTIRIYSANEVIKTLTDVERNPWDFSGLKYKLKQGGYRDYTLCADCNSYTGANYVQYFQMINKSFAQFLSTLDLTLANSVYAKIKIFRPNPFLKEVLAMFASLTNITYDEEIKQFLLDKDKVGFSSKKYKVFISLYKRGLNRIIGWTILGSRTKNGIKSKLVSEIVAYPFVFVLLGNADEFDIEETKYLGADITYFKDFKFEQEVELELNLPLRECNINFPCDYRTQKEILECRKQR